MAPRRAAAKHRSPSVSTVNQPSKTFLAWTCVVTAVATILIGFNRGCWVTGGTSPLAAAMAGDTARGELASAPKKQAPLPWSL